jgi:ketosteroid isomerase-like protein
VSQQDNIKDHTLSNLRGPCSILLGIMVIVTACQSNTPEPPDPTAVIDQYIAAINAHDVEGALQFVAEDAVYRPDGDEIQGKSEIRKFIEENVAQLVSVERVGEYTVDGEQVAWTEHGVFKNPFGQGPNLEVVIHFEAVVREGKIISLTGMSAP